MSHRRIHWVMSLGLCFGSACGDDQSPATDAASADATTDGGIPDAGLPDAFDPCPGKTPFQVRVADWSSDLNLPGIVVQEGDTANMVTSAPNGRVVLCIPNTGPVTVRFRNASYLDRVHSTTGEIAAQQYAAGTAPSFQLLSVAQATTLYASAAETRSDAATTVILMVRTRPSGDDAAGAVLSIAATHEGAYTPGGDADTLVPGSTTTAEGRVLFLNTEVDPATTTLQVAGFTNCSSAAAVALEAGGVSSASIVCDP